MDDQRFVGWTRVVRALTTRRIAFRGLFGGGLAALAGWLDPGLAEANKRRKRKQRLRQRRRKKRRQASRCTPEATAVTCSLRCNATPLNNCGQSVTCSCAAGSDCLGNDSCAIACGKTLTCPGDCICAKNTEGVPYCHEPVDACAALDLCRSTAECPAGHLCTPVLCDGSQSDRCVPACRTQTT